ncbi:hypothetical protein B0H63DRAFT_456185 [Podospora didyma]|uniref:Myb-like domain-containing protein n=1 Tax=Podospora didyma TaxID=330526 RepID=A0AAE0JY38_9PEZI|nr:hypothetical protein B0H63DRAFT_456185 [Podospora didyma]
MSFQDDFLDLREEGKNWNQIKNEAFPYKSGNACRKRHERLMERQKESAEDSKIEEKMCDMYKALRESLWQPLALKTGLSWDVVESFIMSSKFKQMCSRNWGYSRNRPQLPVAWYSDEDSGISNVPHTDDMRIGQPYRYPNMNWAADGPASKISVSDSTFPEEDPQSYVNFDYPFLKSTTADRYNMIASASPNSGFFVPQNGTGNSF